MRMNPCSAIVTCMNEEHNIAACLESLLWADEIVVVDSGSTDGTLEVARRYTSSVFVNTPYAEGAQRNFAAQQARHDWIFLLDCDERVTPPLQEELATLLTEPMERDCYQVWRTNTFFGKAVSHSGWDGEWLYRLYRRDACRWSNVRVHCAMTFQQSNPRIARLRHRIEHHPYPDFDTYFEKFGRYTTWGAQDLHDKGRRTGMARIVLNPLWSFLKFFLLKKGFLDGIPGFLISGLSAFYVFVKYAKLWAIQNGEAGPATPKCGTPGTGQTGSDPHTNGTG